MAWNEPGGGRKDPWGGKGGREQPPDLDDMLRKLKNSIAGLFGGGQRRSGDGDSGGSGGLGGLLLLIVGIAMIWLLFDSFHIIDQRQRGVVLRFGEFVRVLEPGPQWTLPRPIEQVYRVDVTQVRSSSDTVSMLTADENLIIIDFALQYDVKDARSFVFQVRQPEESLTQAAESAVRQVVGSRTLDEVLVGSRAEITLEARGLTQELIDLYGTGINVRTLNFQDVRVPDQVKEAFDDAIKAREDEQRFANEARAYASKEVPEARGRASRVLEQARGYRDSVIARARGEAARFELLVTEYKNAPDVTRRRIALDTLRATLQRTPKVIMDSSSGNLMVVPLDKLLEQARGAEANGPVVTRREGN
ncbi:MAG: FtsH protease activity modulator HflK [Xanthomonadales bacterium]|nr:FtsH protease activity modulator HflK [Xanthomonadales bacterium]MCB1634214.1 FtsH protease activity modulator HflK [Xanthomonadales bacterium]